MTVYLTKVWGFGIPVGPLQFSTSGWRDRARELLSDGDIVVLVGTKGPPTMEDERGRLLGLMEPTLEPVMWLDFPLQTLPHEFTETGEYRWPYGLINRRAWTLLERPLLEEVSARQFNMDAASGIVRLTGEEADAVLKLPRREAELHSPFRVIARTEAHDIARRRNAPVPTTTRSGVMHVRRLAAYTYAMQIHGASTSAFKIGWAFDYTTRVREFNHHSLPGLGGLRYVVRFIEFWATARQAFAMEQVLLRSFDGKRHPANREVVHGISYEELQSAWSACIQRLRRKGGP